MESFVSGKASKVTAIFLFALLPRLITTALFTYDYHLGVIIGAVLTLLFMQYFNKSAIEKIKTGVKSVKLFAIFTLAVAIFALQFIFLFLSFRTGGLTVDNNWLTYEKIIGFCLFFVLKNYRGTTRNAQIWCVFARFYIKKFAYKSTAIYTTCYTNYNILFIIYFNNII